MEAGDGASAGEASSAEHSAPMALAELQAAVASAAQIHLLAAQPLPVVMSAFADAMAADSGVGGAGAEQGGTPRRGGGGSGRGRASTAGSKPRSGTMFCQVEDCGAPLEGLREYHQRYKVCEEHLKTPFIIKDGEQVRFCQQCGRFQPLSEFDGDKRSCRVRLQRHNARRRKRPRDGTSLAGAGSTADLSQLGGAAAAEMAKLQAQFAKGPAAPPAVSQQEVQAMQEALHFATTTLAHSTQAPAQPEGEGEDQGETEGGDGGGNGPAQGLGPGSMPFVPAPDVMMLLLKGYAAMFHYYLDAATIRPLAPPSELPADLLGAAGMAGVEGLMAAGQLGGEGQSGAGKKRAAQSTGSTSQHQSQQQQEQEEEEEEERQELEEAALQEEGEAESPNEATSATANSAAAIGMNG